MSAIGAELNRKWRVGAKHALYREDGKWYHLLRDFPGALFDKCGYILFESPSDYHNSVHLQIGKHLHVRDGIASIPGYILVEAKTSQANLKESYFAEGGAREITQELASRNRSLKKAAIEAHGTKCQICGFDFSAFYGHLGGDFIEVHHLVPISDAKEKRLVSAADVAVVCANCHRVLHRHGKNPLSLDAVRNAIDRAARNS